MDSVKIQNLINYAKYHLKLNPLDEIYVRNRLLEATFSDEFEANEGNIDVSKIDVPDQVIDPILDELIATNKIDASLKEGYLCKLMDIVSLRPSEIEKIFHELYDKKPLDAFKWLISYSEKNSYVKKSSINNNIKWVANGTKGPLEITINLSKPEKTLAQVKQAAKANNKYPKCAICVDNMGFYGHNITKQNLRGIYLNLNNEKWFWQYSPYGYFNEHGIALNTKHTPMVVEKENIKRLFDFLDYIPEYFIGFNAALPIVGGSILAHDHYQGGNYVLPLDKAQPKYFYNSHMENVEVSRLDWYNNVIEIKSSSRKDVEKLAGIIIDNWKKYNDIENVIIASDEEGIHNSISATSRKMDEKYVLHLILRNNKTSSEYPDGIYHAHREYFNIKQESIGLIEAAGLFILPARLLRQLGIIEKILTGETITLTDDMFVHKDMINRLTKQNGTNNTLEKSQQIVRNEINRICVEILKNTAIFKDNEQGEKGFDKFMLSIGMERL